MELSSQKQHLFRSTIYTESLLFIIYMSVVLCIVEMVAWQKVAFFDTKQQDTRADVMICVSPEREQICFILETMNFTSQYQIRKWSSRSFLIYKAAKALVPEWWLR